MKTWVITDTHLYHFNIIKYENRPLDFNERIITNWQALVGPEDLIYHLGDVIFKRQGTLGLILASLPGRKIMIRGNHDMNNSDWYVRKGFESVWKYFITDDGIVLSHEPVNIEELEIKHGCDLKYNVHGHFHNKNREELSRSILGYPFYSDKHKLLSIEAEDYKPVLLDEFIKR
jgi:calcineurin-like phosphoesterase family protein